MTASAVPPGPLGDLSVIAAHLRRRAGQLYWRLRPGGDGGPPAIDPADLPPFGSVIEIDGLRLRVDPLMSPFNIQKLARGRHTLHERALLSEHLRDDDRVIELGGGIGMVAIHCARRLGPGRVASWEGNPRMEALIRENYALNGVAPELHMAVLGEAPGETVFFLAERFSHSGTSDNTGTGTPVTVPVEPFEAARRRLAPTVLVIDIQGGEVAFFGHASLDGVRMILVEFHPPVTGLAPILAIRRRLRRAGFREASRAGTSSVFLRAP
jgi:FkbM family methyltransferase